MLRITIFTLMILCIASFIFAQPLPPAPVELVWESMFPPPGLPSPQISLDMQCISENNCYIAGGSNGVGFGVYHYDGKMDGQVSKMMDNNMSMIVMDLAMGGTDAQPKGAFSGVVDFTVGAGLQYLQGGTTWTASAMPVEIVWAGESISGSADGQNYVAVGAGFTNNLMVSSNAGATFSQQPFTYPITDNCTAPGMIATPSNNAWFMSFGAEPARHNGGSGSGSSSGSGSGSASSSFRNNNQQQSSSTDINAKYYDTKTERIIARKAHGRVLVIKNTVTGKIRTHVKTAFEAREDNLAAMNSDSKCNYYTGAILKSTDQGKTWTKVYENKNALVSYIQCFDSQSCAATAFNADESYTIVTTNGNTWQITLSTPPASQTSAVTIGNVGYASKTEVWVGGSKESQSAGAGMFWSSKDGGLTWTKYPHTIPDIMVIMSVTFTPSGTGFASGLTMFKTTEIMRYKKQSDYGSFIQSQCPIKGCTFLCQNITFPQGMCLQASGGSAKAFCQPDGILQYIYQTTSCVGSYQKIVQPINQCLNGTNNFFENYCPGNSGINAAARKATPKDVLRH